jgi:phage tail sheath protein FI
MTTFVSPGVYSVEKDLSQYVSDLSSTILGLVGTSEIGPTNTPVLITSPQEYNDIFGGISSKHYMGYAAASYLKKGNFLWVNRVSPSDAKTAKDAFILPSGYSNYAGDWVLTGQSATELTFTLSDSIGVTGANKVVKLDAGTVIPGFNFTDSAQTAPANGKLGADMASFVSTPGAITGNIFTVSLGAGKGTSATITSVIDNAGSPAIKVPVSSFTSNNSPATAYAVGSIVSTGAAVSSTISLGICANSQVIKIAASGVKNTALLAALKVNDYSQLETTLSVVGVAPADLTITLPLVAAESSYNLDLIAAAISCLLSACNVAASATSSYPKLTAWLGVIKFQLAGGTFGIGSANGGIQSVSTLLDSLANVIEVHVDSVLPGFSGISTYPNYVGTGLTVLPQSLSGKFTTSAYRPTWKMESAGSIYVPTIIKITSLGDADASDTAVTLSLDTANVTTTQQQLYTLKVYERINSASIPSSSYRLADFTLVEQFDGTIESIQSKVTSSSRRVSLKIDYSTTDSVDITTGIVTPSVLLSDGLVHTPVLVSSETGQGAATGFTVVLGASGYDLTLTDYLSGGSAGTVVTKNDIIGTESARTGIYAFANPEMIDINVLSVPGWSADPSVAKAMTALAEQRGDVIALIDSPFGLSVQNVVNYRKNILNLNSSYAAMYYPWVKITDSTNKKDIFVPPTGLVAAQYAYTDQVSDVFYAPAGRTRGSLTEALAVERNLTQGDRDVLALNQINPIHSEAGAGIYIKGQRTLQSATTALDRVNVRRLLLKLRKIIASASRSYEFEPGDSITAQKLKQLAESVLEDHLRRGAISEYTVDVGPNVNTPLVRENNELRMNISLIPTKTAEILIETYLIQNQGGGVSLA